MATRICYLCGEKYKYCPECSQDRMKPAFMEAFHSENCNKIFDICTKYHMDMLSKEDATNMLKECDLSRKDHFRDCIKRDLDFFFDEEVQEVPTRGKRSRTKIADEASGLHEVVTIKK